MNADFLSVGVALLESECREQLAAAATVEDKLQVVFKVAHDHWMIPNHGDQQFRCALGTVLVAVKGGPDYDRLKRSIDRLSQASALIHALQTGIPVDMEAMLQRQIEEDKGQPPVIPLSKLWNDHREKVRG